MLSLIILKPDAVERRLIGPLLTAIETVGDVQFIEMRKLWPPELKELYKQHSNKEYWPRIESFMSRGPSVIVVVDHIGDLRQTAVTLRERYHRFSANKAENMIHCSEHGEGIREIGLIARGYQWPDTNFINPVVVIDGMISSPSLQ